MNNQTIKQAYSKEILEFFDANLTESMNSIIYDSKTNFLKLLCMLMMSNSNILKSINSKINKIDTRVRHSLKIYNISRQKSSYQYINIFKRVETNLNSSIQQFSLPIYDMMYLTPTIPDF